MINVNHLVKRFDSLAAVNDISFDVAPGEVLGFLGPNGAGKSTTMKMLTGFLRPTSGQVSIFGHDIETRTRQAQQLMGYLPEGAPCYDEMTPASFLNFIADIRGLTGARRQQRLQQVIGTLSLQAVLGQRIETLSKGFKRRVGMAQAILHDPQVLILDEPTDGLDPNQKHQVREMIRSLAKDKIVIISTHILEEVTAVCTRAMIIAQGRVVADCEPAELEQRSRYHGAVTLGFEESVAAADYASALAELPSIGEIDVLADSNQLTVFPASAIPSLAGPSVLLMELAEFAKARQLPVVEFVQEKGRLDEVFRQVTQSATGEALS